MPYGSGQRLGETIDPRLMQADYSGFTNAAAVTGNAIANIGQQIGAGIKQNNENQKEIAGKIKMAEAIKKSIPGLGEMADKVITDLTNPDLSTSEKLRAAEGINEAMQVSILGNQERRANASLNIQQDELAAKINAAKNAPIQPPHSETFGAPGGEQKMIWNGRTGKYEYPQDPQGNNGQTQSNLGSNLPDALKPYVKDFESAGNKYGVPPNILAAISMHETGNGTSSAFRNKNNAMGIANESGPIQMGSVPESIDRMARLLGQGINEGTGPYANAKSIEDIGKIYAPVGAGNDSTGLNQNWSSGVTSNIEKLSRNAEAQGIADASQSRFGFKANESATKQKFELVTLPDGTKAYGNFDSNGVFQPARLQDGKPMQFKEGQTLTAKEAFDIKSKQDESSKLGLAAVDKSKEFLMLLNKLETHPGFNNLFGINTGSPTWLAGTDAADAKVMFKQIDAKGFLEAIKEMKGMGALSNEEGLKASNAFLGLDPSMSEDAARDAIKSAKETIQLGIERATSGNFLPTNATDPRALNASRLQGLTTNPKQQ